MLPRIKYLFVLKRKEVFCLIKTGPILERKGMHALFQKNGRKCEKRAKYLKIWAKMHKI